jgi:hypothetical protein
MSVVYRSRGVRLSPRCQLMLDVTCHTLTSDPDLRLCEGLRLIEATRTAISRLAPEMLDHFDLHILPQLRELLMERFGIDVESFPNVN